MGRYRNDQIILDRGDTECSHRSSNGTFTAPLCEGWWAATMLLTRGWPTTAPPAKGAVANNPTLLLSWWCTGFALAIILVRLSGRYVRTEKLFREDKIMALSIIPLLARMGLVHVVLLWGTNNTITTGLAPLDIQHRVVGSKLVLASRIMYAAL